jgi:hypothetical protein
MKKLASFALVFIALLVISTTAQAQQLQKFTDCKIGMRVSTNDGRKGTITRLDVPWSYCWVKFDDNGKETELLYSLLNVEAGKGQPVQVTGRGEQLQKFTDCKIGMRVSTIDGRKGTITRLDVPWSYCWVKFDDNGKETELLYSLLNSEEGAAGKQDPFKLAVGPYECVTGTAQSMILHITGANTYSIPEGKGTFKVGTDGKIVFESGPMKEFHSMLLSGGRIGLNQNGGKFYNTACSLNRNLK